MWSTLRKIFIAMKNWASHHVKWTIFEIFPQTVLDKNEHIYMHLLRVFYVNDTTYCSEYVLSLKNNMYGLK